MSIYYVLLAVAIVTETIATMLLKASEQFTRVLPSIGVVAFYAASFYCLSVCQKVFPVAVIYAIWSAVGMIFVAFFATIIFKQVLDFPAILGIALIISGVIVINIFSKTMGN